MREDKKIDNTIEELANILEKYKDENEELNNAYERICNLKSKRGL